MLPVEALSDEEDYFIPTYKHLPSKHYKTPCLESAMSDLWMNQSSRWKQLVIPPHSFEQVIVFTLRSNRKGSSLCHNPFKGFTLLSESFEGLKGVWDQTTLSWRALLRHYAVSTRRRRHHAKNLRKGSWEPEVSISCTLRNPSLHKGPLKWTVLSTSVWNDPSIWQPWLFSLRSALRRAIYPVWNAPTVLGAIIKFWVFSMKWPNWSESVHNSIWIIGTAQLSHALNRLKRFSNRHNWDALKDTKHK